VRILSNDRRIKKRINSYRFDSCPDYKIKQMKLPTDYTKLTQPQRREVRIQYIKEQNNLCMYCGETLDEVAPKKITDKPINWRLFPEGFLQHPIHLQHCHKTNMTEGAVHSYCNAVLWQYEGR